MGLLDPFKDFGRAIHTSVSQDSPTAISEEYKRILGESKYNPNPIPGDQLPVEASPLDQWRNQIHGMLTSKNKNVRNAGKGMMNAYHQRATTPSGGSSSPAAIKEYQFARGQGFDGSFQDWKSMNKASTTVNVGNTAFLNPTEASKLRYKNGDRVDPFTPKTDLVGKVRVVTAKEAGELTGAEKSIAMVDDMDGMLFGDNGILSEVGNTFMDRVEHGVKSNVQQFAQTDPRYKNYTNYTMGTLAPLAKSLGQAGSLSDTDLALVTGLIPSITGVNPDSPKVAKEKIAKLRRLIQAGLNNGKKLTKEHLDEVLGKDRSGAMSQPDSWTEGGYEYRRTNGKVQRRKL